MDLQLGGKVAVVTGASRGIGRAVVELLVAEGAYVVAGARDVSSLAGLAGVDAIQVDLATPAGPEQLITAATTMHGGLDLLVNNVGAGRLHSSGFASITDTDWQSAFDVNLLSAVRATRASLPCITERRGAIVNVSSLNGKVPAKEAPEYSAMKAALLNLTRSLAIELAPAGVRVNAVTPGPVATDMQIGPGGIAEQLGVPAEEYRTMVDQAVPMGRMASAEEVANVVVLLLSPVLGYVSGADYAVDGLVQGG